jgi:hypothetical protein
MHRTFLALAFVASTAALPAPAAHAQSGGTPLTVPERVGDYRRTDLRETSPGHTARFESKPGRYLDVYFYGFPRGAACGSACDSVAVHAEADAVQQMAPMLVERGMYERLEITADSAYAVAAGPGSWRGRHVTMRGARGGADVVSQFYLVSAGDFLVKLRATYRPDPAVDAEIAGFLAELAPMLAEDAPPCPAGPYGGQVVGAGVDDEAKPADVAARVRAALSGLGYELRPGSDDAEIVTRTRWERPAGWDRTDAPHPGHRVRVEIEARGEGSRVTFTGSAVCATAPDAQPSADVIGMMAALEAAGAFTRKTKGPAAQPAPTP